MKTMRMYLLVPAATLALAACSGRGGDAAASAAASPDAAPPASQPDQGAPAAAPVAGSGEMQALLAKLVAPARNAADAAARFTWVGGNDPEPAGALRESVDAVQQAMKARDAEVQAAETETRKTMLPPQMAAMANDPKAQQAMEKKLNGMSQQEKIAWAMQMASSQAAHMGAQMQAQAQEVTEEDEAAQQKFSADLMQLSLHAHDVETRIAKARAEKDQLDRQSQAAHQSIDRDLQVAIGKVPYQQEGEGGGGCYSTANARHVYDLKLQAADKHVAQADRDLDQAARWAADLRAALEPVAKGDDALHADLVAIRHSPVQSQNLINASSIRSGTLNDFDRYVKDVQAADLSATQWVRTRDQRRKEDWSLLDCNVNHG
jgi:hypothetical protein